MSKQIRKLFVRLLGQQVSESLTQRMIDGSGEHRRRCHWTIFQMRNAALAASDYRRAEH